MHAAHNKSGKLRCAISAHKCHPEAVLGALLNNTSRVSRVAQSPSLVHPLLGSALRFCTGWTKILSPSCTTHRNFFFIFFTRMSNTD